VLSEGQDFPQGRSSFGGHTWAKNFLGSVKVT